jgi:hypothetical protein
MFVLCGYSALHIHIHNIIVFAHQDNQMKVDSSKFPDASLCRHDEAGLR